MIKSSLTMDRYKEFCRLRDYRKPGMEVCHYTEAEAFALANRDPFQDLVTTVLPTNQIIGSTKNDRR